MLLFIYFNTVTFHHPTKNLSLRNDIIFRPKFKSWVNCWFCNSNQWVPWIQRNGFTCKKCDQYNGFDDSGDYNRFMASQRIEGLNTNSLCQKGRISPALLNTNGLCDLCNQMQAVIVERLNKFEAVDEVGFQGFC